MADNQDALVAALLGAKTPQEIDASRSRSYETKMTPEQQVGFPAWVDALAQQQRRDPAAVMRDTHNYDLQGAYLSQLQSDERGHLTDTFKKPNHPTFSDQSQYSGVDGNVGGVWDHVGRGRHSLPLWRFTPSETNMQHQTPQELQDYWRQVEAPAGNILRMPRQR